MIVSAAIPPTIQMRRSRLLRLLAAVAAAAAVSTCSVLTFAADTGSEPVTRSKKRSACQPGGGRQAVCKWSRQDRPAGANAAVLDALGHRPSSTRRVRFVMDLTPGDLAGGGLWGYALRSRQSGPTLAEVLAPMSRESRRYVTTLMRLTFRQLAQGAAGHPQAPHAEGRG
jgi:hypothetical protein